MEKDLIKELHLLKENILLFQSEMAQKTGQVMIAHAKKRTPVGVYKDKRGGTLRKGWDKEVRRTSKGYKVDVFNDVYYAPYVNYGHRIVRHGETIGYVKGQYMLENSVKSTQEKINKYYENRMKRIAKEFNK